VTELRLIPPEEFERAGGDLGLLADMCRANALVAVKRAGSGHLGSSFSALDIVVHLLWRELNVAELGWEHPDRDVFFSSKGHDVPGLYAALNALGVIPTERLLRLRRRFLGFGRSEGLGETLHDFFQRVRRLIERRAELNRRFVRRLSADRLHRCPRHFSLELDLFAAPLKLESRCRAHHDAAEMLNAAVEKTELDDLRVDVDECRFDRLFQLDTLGEPLLLFRHGAHCTRRMR
jgi:hypothetical protein